MNSFLFLIFNIYLINASETEDREIEKVNNCQCVYYYQCDKEGFVITDGSGLLTARAGFNDSFIACKTDAHWCCKLKNKPEEAKTTTEAPNENNLKCGIQRTVFNIRSLGSSTIAGEFPWIGAVFRKDLGSFKFACAGSLIHPKVLLTVNHCVRRKTTYKIALNGRNELPSEETDLIEIEEIIKHPSYYSGGLHNDIALLILKTGVKIDRLHNYINTICLPKKKFGNKTCIVAGWGKQNVMTRVQLPLVPFNKCEKLLKKTRLGNEFNLHNSFMCAGGGDEDACGGFGGSPLMCESNNRYYLAGMVSWGVDCQLEDVPGVYTNVKFFKEWIEKELLQRHIDFQSNQ